MIDKIRRLIGEELVQARLSTKLKIVDHINDAFLETSSLDLSAFRLAPDATEHWREEVSAEIGVIVLEKGQLMEHIIATADELQNKAEKCKP